MAGRAYDTGELIAAVKRRTMLPSSQATWTDARIVAVADEEMRERVVPFVLGLGGEHLVTYTDVAIVEGTLEYEIPSAALGGRLRDAVVVDSDGVVRTDLALTTLDRLLRLPLGVAGFHVRANAVVFPQGAVAPGELVRLYYHRRPSLLVPVASAAQVTAVDTGTGIVTCSSVPAAWTVGTAVSATGSTPPFAERFASRSLVSAATPTVQLAPSDTSGLVVGDWLGLVGESAVPQLPAEAWAMLLAATSTRILRALGADDGMEDAAFDRAADAFTNANVPRVDGEPRKAIGADPLFDAVGWPGTRSGWGW